MKLLTSAFLLALSSLSAPAFAVNSCVVEITFDGFLDARPCQVPADSSQVIKTGYTACSVPVVLDANCKIVSYDFSDCSYRNPKIDAYIGKAC